jgi:hypothetical protein
VTQTGRAGDGKVAPILVCTQDGFYLFRPVREQAPGEAFATSKKAVTSGFIVQAGKPTAVRVAMPAIGALTVTRTGWCRRGPKQVIMTARAGKSGAIRRKLLWANMRCRATVGDVPPAEQ